MKHTILAVVMAAGIGGFVSSSDAQGIKKLQPHPDAAADQSLRQGSVGLPSQTASPGAASTDHPKPTTGAAVPSGGASTGQSKQH
jgi:hypothetical protein